MKFNRSNLHLFSLLVTLWITLVSCRAVWDIENQQGHSCGAPGTPLPDLMVDVSTLARDVRVSWETFRPTDCDVVEGNFEPGRRKVLRFSVTTPNVGDADISIGDPCTYWLHGALFEYAPCHDHFHFKHYARYELIALNDSGIVIPSQKQGFCMIDTTTYGSLRPPQFTACGRPGRDDMNRPACSGPSYIAGHQGLSVGWADTYGALLPGQFFVVDGLSGRFRIRIVVNAPFNPLPSGRCPAYAVKVRGMCYQICEKDYSNNVAYVDVVL
eukprot:TRINITY_DN24882_c0_g1_i1.p1 TRINITY_DN24882_c0_g1~~TRINITY_DN24882_c0_g1_i1.p1  ORF type:complete len:270 (+),score=9.13 TRINITY_DN24882_c0_g1_i1:135-944(+)